ncbi:Internalin-J precursor [Chlamydia abortus]|uniref:Leucine-rich repeat domain-containing protein n=1 Tax=Paenibacillus residui TaxID=629724 RepID=A0ABW3DCX7_9BACL|nr:Internalin-J precursor [Chlamydia abortus]
MNITQDFVDERFKTFVLEKFCENREWIETGDVERVVSLQLANQGFSSLKGIEHFASLEELDCSFNNLTKLDIGTNIHLRTLECGGNNLQELNCSYNSMFSLNLEHNTLLTHLDCGNNYLISLNIKNCTKLIEIRCNHNHLTKLDVTGNPDLLSLRCFNNHITGLDLSHNSRLVELYCSENKISKLDTLHNPKLERLDYADNLIVQPDHTVKGIATFTYDSSLSYYTAALHYQGNELSVTADVPAKADMKRLSPIIKKAWLNLDELTLRALDLIAQTHPDEDVSELVLSELRFDGDGTTRLGYDAGDTPAGQLYIYVSFNRKLEMNRQLIYETY